MAMAYPPAQVVAYGGQVRGSRAALGVSHPRGTEAGGGVLFHWGATAAGLPPQGTCPSGAVWVVFRCPAKTNPLTAATASPHFVRGKSGKQPLFLY